MGAINAKLTKIFYKANFLDNPLNHTSNLDRNVAFHDFNGLMAYYFYFNEFFELIL